MDSAHKETDKLIERLEKEITATYTEAQKEVEAKFEKYLESFAEKDKAKLAQVQAGSLSQTDYAAWRQSQILVGKRWKDMSNALAQDLANADALSQQLAKGYMLDAYTLNMNYALQTIGNDASVNTTFTLYNRDAVEKMIKDNPKLLPAMSDETARKIREGKLIKWNEQKITSSVTQSILQGESIDKLAKRLQSVTDMDKRASIRNARTAMTGAENAGRQGAMERATNMGIELERQWVATHDSRTRDWHADLDGQIKPVEEPWENEYGKIMYPADPSAHPANVYNCRCSIRSIVKGGKSK